MSEPLTAEITPMDDESQYHPFETTVLTGHRVLALSPHPDDESLACGGSLALHAHQGDRVKVVFLTDGTRADTLREYSREQYLRLRQEEARKAGSVLGLTDLEFWNIPDRELMQAGFAIGKLCELLEQYEPTLIYAPSPLEFHPDHRAAAKLVWQAVQRARLDCKVAFYDYNRPININTLVDISSVVETKRQAGSCYQSQLKYYPYAECALSFNRYRALTVSSHCQYAEGFFVLDACEIWSNPIETFTIKQFLPARARSEQPLVSVVVRTRNRIALLREALASVLTQTYPNIEVVVVNDGGDDVSQVINEFTGYIPIRHIDHDLCLGRARAANSGLLAARGKYINFLDDDDLLYSHHIEKLATFLEKSGESFAYSDCEKCDYRWNGETWVPSAERQLFNGVDFDRNKLDQNNYIAMMSAMFRKELFELSGPFDESLQWLEDWDLWIRMARYASFHRLPGVTAEYRRFSEQQYDNQFWTHRVYEKHQGRVKPEHLVNRLRVPEALPKIYRLAELPVPTAGLAMLPALRGHIDQVAPADGGRVHIVGWTLSLDRRLDAIEVHYGGQQLGTYRLCERLDVANHVPWIDHSLLSGFEFTLDIGDVEKTGGAGLLELVGLSAAGVRSGLLWQFIRADLDRFPSPPAECMSRTAHASQPRFFKAGGLKAFGDIVTLLNRHVKWESIHEILDWGCGAGRVSAQFLSALPSIALTGVDIDQAAIDWCRSNLIEGTFHVVPPMPPTDYEDSQFDLVVSCSVFTHLKRDVQEAWLREIYRILEPGGWFVATTHGDFALQFATQTTKPPWPAGEFYDIADATMDGIAPLDYYRAAFQSERYTRTKFGEVFQIIEYIPRGAMNFQDLVLMRKPQPGDA